jgi:soluble cytochrome b562
MAEEKKHTNTEDAEDPWGPIINQLDATSDKFYDAVEQGNIKTVRQVVKDLTDIKKAVNELQKTIKKMLDDHKTQSKAKEASLPVQPEMPELQDSPSEREDNLEQSE